MIVEVGALLKGLLAGIENDKGVRRSSSRKALLVGRGTVMAEDGALVCRDGER